MDGLIYAIDTLKHALSKLDSAVKEYEYKTPDRTSKAYIEAKSNIKSMKDAINILIGNDIKNCMYCEKELRYSQGIFICKECSS